MKTERNISEIANTILRDYHLNFKKNKKVYVPMSEFLIVVEKQATLYNPCIRLPNGLTLFGIDVEIG